MFVCLLIWVMVQLDLLCLLGFIIVDMGLVWYCFSCFMLGFVDGQCSYCIILGVLLCLLLLQGYLVIVLFDGNVVLVVIDELQLQVLQEGLLLVIVVVGYDMVLCFDVVVCVYDYMLFIFVGQVDDEILCG